MSTSAEVAAQLFAALQSKDPEDMAALQHEDVVDDFVAVGVYRGKPAVRAFFEELFTAFPDFTMTVDRITGDEEYATVQWRATGSFTGGPFQGVRPTGRSVDLHGVDVMHIVDGRLLDTTTYYDGLGFARQIGMLPAKDSRGDRAITAGFNAATGIKAKLPLPSRG
jgi:steroid delta-isomerase-like uncharacterized protein